MTEWDGKGLVSTQWLSEHLNDPELSIFDATVHLRPAQPGPYRVESGRADYEAGHVPGAAFADLARDFSDTGAAFAFTMPSLDRFAAALGAAGVGPGARVVVYSTTTPMWATRLWWMLRASGFDNAAVLDGGFAKWRDEGRPVESGVNSYAPDSPPTLAARADAWADKQAVLAAIDDGAVCTINALPPALHTGEGPMSYGRKGRIAGSRNVPYAALLRADGTYLDDAELRKFYDAVGAVGMARAICYCGGGISATMNALALTRLGHPSVAVYDGSMSEWTADPDLPMETGAEA